MSALRALGICTGEHVPIFPVPIFRGECVSA
jgi:hypothetical protein